MDELLAWCSSNGLRVLGVASRTLDEHFIASAESAGRLHRLTRDEVEQSLTFCGLLVMKNDLKGETQQTIALLHAARIRTVMITGDSIHTAISVGFESGLVPFRAPVILVDGEVLAPTADSNGRRVARLRIDQYRKPEASEQLIRNIFVTNESPDVAGETRPREPPQVQIATSPTAFNTLNALIDSFAHTDTLTTVLAPVEEYAHLAVTGNAYVIIKRHFPELLDRVITRSIYKIHIIIDLLRIAQIE